MKRLVYLVAAALPFAAAAQVKGTKNAASEKSAKAAAAPAAVNWEGQVIKATGSGAPDMRASSAAQARLGAEMAAKMDAFRNLLAQAKGIQVTTGKTVGDEMAKDEIRGRVEGVIRGYKITDKRYFSDQGVEIDVEVPLSALTAVVSEPSDKQVALNTSGEKKNTGLVIDARGLKVTKALAPRVLDASGRLLYAADCLSDDAKKTVGVAAYFPNLDEVKKSARVGEKPLVVKAAKVDGADLVLSGDDLKKLTEADNSYLAEGRVAIIAN